MKVRSLSSVIDIEGTSRFLIIVTMETSASLNSTLSKFAIFSSPGNRSTLTIAFALKDPLTFLIKLVVALLISTVLALPISSLSLSKPISNFFLSQTFPSYCLPHFLASIEQNPKTKRSLP